MTGRSTDASADTADRETSGRGGPTGERCSVQRILSGRPPLRATLGHFWPFLRVAVAVFVLVALLGFAVVGPALADEVGDDPFADDGPGIVASDTVHGYFVNNMGVAVVLMGGFGVVTLLALAYNALLLGAAAQIALAKGVPAEKLFLAIVPHGVVEVPGLLLASAIGLFFPYRVWTYRWGSREAIADHEDEIHLLQTALLVATLVFLAAVVETYVTHALVAF